MMEGNPLPWSAGAILAIVAAIMQAGMLRVWPDPGSARPVSVFIWTMVGWAGAWAWLNRPWWR